MTTDKDAELAARVARLQQRRGNTGAKAATARSATAPASAPTPAATTVATAAAPKVAGPDSHFAFKPTPTAPAGDMWAPPVNATMVSATPPASMFAKIATVTGIHKIVQVANAHHEAQLAYEALPEAKVVDKQTNLKVTKSRRRHAAAAGRVLATGLATSGFLACITVLAQADEHPEPADAANGDQTSVKTIERTIYVDEFGNPVAPPVSTLPDGSVDPTATTLPGAVVDPAATDTTLVPGVVPAAVPGAVPVAGAPVAGAPVAGAPVAGAPVVTTKAGAPVTTVKGATPVAGTPTPVAAAPTPAAPTPAAPTPAAPVTAAPAPVTAAPAPVTAAPAPVTAAPAPVTTAAPPPTTAKPAPTTTAAPACTGSKCP